MKKFFILLLLPLFLSAEMLNINNFSTDIFSKIDKTPKKITLSLMIQGRYVKDENYKILDALNVVIGSFYIENLLTSKGKENFKKLLINYTAQKYSIDIDNVYIEKLIIDQNSSANDIISALKQGGCCK